MQTLLLPVVRSGSAPAISSLSLAAKPSSPHLISSFPQAISFKHPPNLRYSLSSSFFSPLKTQFLPYTSKSNHTERILASASISAAYTSSNDDSEKAKLAKVAKRLEKVAKRLENTSRYFKRLGSLGFWGQLVCTIVSAVILSFSVVITGKISSPATFYATTAGIAAAFISVFWSFGYIRLSEKLRRTASDPSKAPPRADVVKTLKNGIVVNLLGMGAAVLGMQATVGLLVAKALTTSVNPLYQGVSSGSSPVLALDVFLVQASANTILSHFLGLVFSLELLRSVTLPPSASVPVPRIA